MSFFCTCLSVFLHLFTLPQVTIMELGFKNKKRPNLLREQHGRAAKIQICLAYRVTIDTAIPNSQPDSPVKTAASE